MLTQITSSDDAVKAVVKEFSRHARAKDFASYANMELYSLILLFDWMKTSENESDGCEFDIFLQSKTLYFQEKPFKIFLLLFRIDYI